MASTTHSSELQLKLIGTGLEGSTWGESTNENISRIEAAISHARSLNVRSMPAGSTSSSQDGTTAAQWVTVESADSSGSFAGEAGSEGRSSAIEFTSSDTVTGAITVEIYGKDTSTAVNRTIVITNSITFDAAQSLVIKAGSSANSITIPQGCSALVALKADAEGGYALGAHNLLSKMQVDDIVLAGPTGSIEFVGDGAITVKPSSTSSLTISDGTTDLVVLDTTNEKLILEAAVDPFQIDGSGSGGASTLSLRTAASESAAFSIGDGTSSLLTVDTTDGEIEIGTTGTNKNLRVWGDIQLENAARDIDIVANSAVALEIKDSAGTLLTADTLTGEHRIRTVPVATPDISITGTDGYIEFNGETFDGTGYGVRDSSGTMQSKSSGGAWTDLIQIVLTTAAVAATNTGDGGAGENKQFTLDLGPYRLVVDTIDITSQQDVTVTAMDSSVYAVMVCYAEDMGGSQGNLGAWVKTSASKIITIDEGAGLASVEVTYFAIGDSGA